MLKVKISLEDKVSHFRGCAKHTCVIIVSYVGVADAPVRTMCLQRMCLYLFVYCIHTCLCSRREVWFILLNYYSEFITVTKLQSNDLHAFLNGSGQTTTKLFFHICDGSHVRGW